MILKKFSEYLKLNKDGNSVILLNKWLIERLKTPSLDKVDIILKTELYYAENNNQKTLIIGKSQTGRTLLNSLYNFALSFEEYKISKIKHQLNYKQKNKY